MRHIIWVSGPLSQLELFLLWLPCVCVRVCVRVCVCEKSRDRAMWITGQSFPVNLDLSLPLAELALSFSPLLCFLHIMFYIIQLDFSAAGNYSSLWTIGVVIALFEDALTHVTRTDLARLPQMEKTVSNWLSYGENLASTVSTWVAGLQSSRRFRHIHRERERSSSPHIKCQNLAQLVGVCSMQRFQSM